MRRRSVGTLAVLAIVVMPRAAAAQHSPLPHDLRASAGVEPFAPDRAPFSVRFRRESTSHRVFGAYVLPGERLPLEARSSDPKARFSLRANGGALEARGDRSWEWTAPPGPGLHTLTLVRLEARDSIRLNVFVMVPFGEVRNGHLNGYRIGEYPTRPLRQLPIYRPPRGFIEVTSENQDVRISPHFTLRQFLSKQESGWPRYVVLKERLLQKLEIILEAMNREGYRAGTLAVLSGYRTPYHNHEIGNVRYSRHVWGDAADVYIDESPRDGLMDDLNADGRIDYRDAGVLYDVVDRMHGASRYAPFVGGLARYRRTSNHGPFVHVDARGVHARWGI